nr:ABC transporter permease [uncultured Caproiciproducens sp.]
MSAHIFTTRLKCLLRDRQTIFWTLMFPLILATFFNMAFANLNSVETFHPIDIAVVNDAGYQQNKDFKPVLENASKGSGRMFNLTAATSQEAGKLLNDGKIKGYITVDSEIRLTVNDSGLSQNIIKSFLESYKKTFSVTKSIINQNPASVQSGLLNDLENQKEYTREVSGNSAEPNTVLNYFYSLIAMACLYGGFFGMKEVTDILANISQRAARVNIAPVHKLKIFLVSMCASLLVHFAELLILLAYLRFGLNIDFGAKTGLVLLTTFVGSVIGILFGAFVSALVPKGEGIKVAIMLAVSMTGSFLAGMMYQDIKYIVAQKVPILSYLNPVNLLTDAFYSLYYYDTFNRYALNMGILGGFIIVFCTVSYLIIRRQKYASL